jgi:hypothetical protein
MAPLAFPQMSPTTDHSDFQGMTIRDVFAGQAMQSIIAQAVAQLGGSVLENDDAIVEAVRLSYRVADAMMIERERD